MPEPITTVGLGAIAAYLSKDGVAKILGPTAEYLGGEIKEFTRKRIENVGNIFSNAEAKLGEDINKPGHVPPKVLKTIINEGSYCEDEIAVDYFGGILASSRTDIGRDDRGARIAKILDGLSTYQIRSHYLVYSYIKNLFYGSGYQFNQDDRPNMEIFIPWNSFFVSMQFDHKELDKLISIVNHSFFGLSTEDLIENFHYGPQEHIVKHCPEATSGGIIVQPSAFGAELYLWGHGEGNKDLAYAINKEELASQLDIHLDMTNVIPSSKKHNNSR